MLVTRVVIAAPLAKAALDELRFCGEKEQVIGLSGKRLVDVLQGG